jgi:putative phage-type endonuclease
MHEQRTEQWHADRCGHATASCFADILAVGKTGKPLKARDDLMMRLVTERLTQTQETGLDSFSMKWGRDVEPFARAAFEAETGLIVTESPFVKHPTIEWVGCSPDGLVAPNAGYESKCPKNSTVHLETIRNGMPLEHTAQVQGCMWVTGREVWHFVSYDPRMPEHLRIYHEAVKRDDAYIAELEKQVIKFLAEVAEQVEFFKRKAA